MSTLVLKRGPSTKLSTLNVEDGAFILTTDTHELHADIGTARYPLGQFLEVNILPTTDINSSKYYFLTSDKCIYRHIDGGWVNLSKAGISITTGKTVGTISVDGVDVAVFGLGTAAYKNVEDFVGTSSDASSADTIYGAKAYAKEQAEAIGDDLDALDESLAAVAKSGAAADVSIADSGNLITATTVEDALAELAGNINTNNTANKVTMTSAGSEDYAMVYTLTQGTTEIGKINIPKDMVVKSGTVETMADGNEFGVAAGTYIKLVLQNDEAPLFINVADLIEYVTSGSSAGDMVVISIDSDHKVTATITDGTVTKAKLEASVQTSLGKADTAVQSVTVLGKTLSEGGTLSADEAKTALGLGSAAYVDTTAFDAAGDAEAAKTAAINTVVGTTGDGADANTVYGAKAHATAQASSAQTNAINTVVGNTGDAATANTINGAKAHATAQASSAQTNAINTVVGTAGDDATANTINGAKAYADSAVTTAISWVDFK